MGLFGCLGFVFLAPINVSIVSLFLFFFFFLAAFRAVDLARRKGLEREMCGAELGKGGQREAAASGRAIKIISHRGKLDFGKSRCGTSGIKSFFLFGDLGILRPWLAGL